MRTRTPHSEAEPAVSKRRRIKLNANLPLSIKVITCQGAIDDVTLAFSQDKNLWLEVYGREIFPKQEEDIIAWFQSFADKKPLPTDSLRLNFSPLSPFTSSALRAICNVPFGDTETYAGIASAIKNPKAVRAIGGACHHNPFPIIIPCHRIISKGGIGGFAYPLGMKQLLLDYES